MIATISKLEEELRHAMCNSDLAKLEQLLSDDLVFTTHTGAVIGKQDDLTSHKNRDFSFTQIKLSEQKIIPLSTTAVVTTQAFIEGEYKGNPSSGHFRFTRVWDKQSGQWQVIAGHASLVNS